MNAYDPQNRTRVLARIVGPYLVVVAVTMFARRAALPLLLRAFMQDAPLVLATGAFTLIAGLVIVAMHHHWTGAAAIVISLIGVAAAVKGALLMAAPEIGAGMTASIVRAPLLLLVAAGVELLLGVWLTLVGWLSKA